MNRILKKLSCFFGFHDWQSTKVGTLEPQTQKMGNGLTIRMMGRTFWDNECRRCGKFVGLTWKYEK